MAASITSTGYDSAINELAVCSQYPDFGDAVHYSGSYWHFQRNIPAWAPQGIWTYRVTYEGVVYEHRFGVGSSATDAENLALVPLETRLRGNRPNGGSGVACVRVWQWTRA